MEFKRVGRVLEDKPEVFGRYLEIVESVRGVPLIGVLTTFLDDSNPLLASIVDRNIEGLVNFIIRFNERVAKVIMSTNKIHKIIEKMEKPFYRMRVSGRTRVATVREIEEGATGLIAETKYAIQDPEKRKMLWLIAWAASGNDYYYYKIGKGFQKNLGMMKVYTQISIAAEELAGLMDWAESGSLYEDIMYVKKFGMEKYQYPDYEVDEVVEDFTRKQLLYMLDEMIPRGTENKEYRKAISLIVKDKTNKYYSVPPEEVAQLRELYKKLIVSRPKSLQSDPRPTEINLKLKEDCEFLLKARDLGVLNRKEFVFKVVKTCMEKNYIIKVSEKQTKIIREAIENADGILRKKIKDNNDQELRALSSLIDEMNRRIKDEAEVVEKKAEAKAEARAKMEDDIPMPDISAEELQEMDRVYEEYGLDGMEDFSSMLGDGFV